MQNTIIKGRDNPVVIEFSFDVPTDPSFGLSNFTDIHVFFGQETYTLLNDPDVVIVNSDTQLQLNLGGTSEIVPSYFTIVGFNNTYLDGYELTSKCQGNLGIPKLC